MEAGQKSFYVQHWHSEFGYPAMNFDYSNMEDESKEQPKKTTVKKQGVKHELHNKQ